jgi:hypothetical protein
LKFFKRPSGGGIVMFNFGKGILTSKSWTRHLRANLGALGLLLAFNQILLAPTYGEDDPHKADADTIRRMNEQIQDLQAKVKELERRLNALAANTPARAGDSGVPVVASPSEAPTLTPTQASQDDKSIPGVKLRMFGDVGYEASDQKGETNSFHIGTLDLFLTGTLSDRVSVLGEVLFTPQTDNGISVDVERLLLQYKQNDYFNFAVGRYHSSIGYYNTAFHQGAWFQTAIDRPFMYAFDDQGGFLPLQEVGISIDGQIPSGNLGLHYVAEMGNGRAHVLGSDPAQNSQDTNNGKSFNLALYSRPSWLPGLQTGFSTYHDYLTFSDNINHDELISTVYVVYSDSDY